MDRTNLALKARIVQLRCLICVCVCVCDPSQNLQQYLRLRCGGCWTECRCNMIVCGVQFFSVSVVYYYSCKIDVKKIPPAHIIDLIVVTMVKAQVVWWWWWWWMLLTGGVIVIGCFWHAWYYWLMVDGHHRRSMMCSFYVDVADFPIFLTFEANDRNKI